MSLLSFPSLAGDIVTYAKGGARLGANPVGAGLSTIQLYAKLHDINARFVKIFSRHSTYPPEFLRDEYMFLTVDKTTLAVASSAGATSITLTSGTNFIDPATDALATEAVNKIGAFYIKNDKDSFDFATYTTKSSNVLSGIHRLDLAHTILSEVVPIYGMPSNFDRPIRVSVNGRPLRKSQRSFSHIPFPGEYLAFPLYNADKSIGRIFFVLPNAYSAGEQLTVTYFIRPNAITDATSKVNLPDGNARLWGIKMLTAYIWECRGEIASKREAEAEAAEALDLYLAEISDESFDPEQDVTFDVDSFYGVH